mgnify:CR=1 FL=1
MKDIAGVNNPFCVIDAKVNLTDSVIKMDKNEFGVGVNQHKDDPGSPGKPPSPGCGGSGFATMEYEGDIIL